MAKKVRDDEDDFDEELDDDTQNEVIESEQESDEDDDSDDDDGYIIDDDDDNLDIIIEIDDEDLNITDDKPEETESETDVVLSKHKVEGKHSLKYDSIFKGKKEDPLDENDDMGGFGMYHKDTIEVDKSSNYYFESIDNEKYV